MLRARRGRPARLWVSLVVAVRVLSVVLGMQLSGVSHLVEDVVSVLAVGHVEHDEQCPADGPCNDCPPGCPQCHCPNALRSVAPPLGLPLLFARDASKAAAHRLAPRAPQSPDLPGLFRPPQAASAVS